MASTGLLIDEKFYEEINRKYIVDIDSGTFVWKLNGGNSRIGMQAGSLGVNGYRTICLFRMQLYEHRVLFALANGRWPDHFIDHINGIRSDNRRVNLREILQSENIQNERKARASNKSTGLLGATFDKSSGKYLAVVKLNYKKYRVGLFESAELAHQAYLSKKRELHPKCTL